MPLRAHATLIVWSADKPRVRGLRLITGETILRHQLDEVFGSACWFLDLETRLCTVHEARPDICRAHPGTPTCGYYVFLMAERGYQKNPRFIARAYNPQG